MRTAFALLVLAALGFIAWRVTRPSPEQATVSGSLPPIETQQRAVSSAAPETAPGAQQTAAPGESAAPTAAAVPGVMQVTASRSPAAEAAAKLAVLEEILLSRNDNDPRLDTAFNDLSPQAKQLFRQKYARLPDEARNERGTVVYLLGKNLKTAEDWAFMRNVVTEPPCLSLGDCSKPEQAEPDSHFNAGKDITLAYPAVMALKRAERILDGGDAAGAAQARLLLQSAKNSRSRTVAGMAAQLESDYASPQR